MRAAGVGTIFDAAELGIIGFAEPGRKIRRALEALTRPGKVGSVRSEL